MLFRLDVELLALKTRKPTAEEQAQLDAQYKRWKLISFAAAGIGCLVFVIGFVF